MCLTVRMPSRCNISYRSGWVRIAFSFNRLIVVRHEKESKKEETIKINNVCFFLFITYTEKVSM